MLFLCKQNLHQGRLTATKCVLRGGQGEKINYIEASRHKQHGPTASWLPPKTSSYLDQRGQTVFLFVSCSTLDALTLGLFCILVSFVHLSGFGTLGGCLRVSKLVDRLNNRKHRQEEEAPEKNSFSTKKSATAADSNEGKIGQTFNKNNHISYHTLQS